MKRFNSYIICTTTRSGSTLLCNLLSKTGVAGKPESYFHQLAVSSWAKALDVPPQADGNELELLRTVFRVVRRNGSAGTDIFGLRLMRKSFDFLMTQLDLLYPNLTSDTARFEAAFGCTHYVHLTREDKVAQAVSLIKATQTGLWHMAPDGTELERNAPPQSLRYNGARIARYVAGLTVYDEDWERWFENQQLAPVRVTYENLSNDLTGTLSKLLARLGLNRAAANGIVPNIARLADETNQNWAKRYRAEPGPTSD
jgi:LPS sulfotransferase NodH